MSMRRCRVAFSKLNRRKLFVLSSSISAIEQEALIREQTNFCAVKRVLLPQVNDLNWGCPRGCPWKCWGCPRDCPWSSPKQLQGQPQTAPQGQPLAVCQSDKCVTSCQPSPRVPHPAGPCCVNRFLTSPHTLLRPHPWRPSDSRDNIVVRWCGVWVPPPTNPYDTLISRRVENEMLREDLMTGDDRILYSSLFPKLFTPLFMFSTPQSHICRANTQPEAQHSQGQPLGQPKQPLLWRYKFVAQTHGQGLPLELLGAAPGASFNYI